MSVVKAICNKVAVLESGQLVDTGKIGEVSLPEDKYFWIDGDSKLTDNQSGKLDINNSEVDGYVG